MGVATNVRRGAAVVVCAALVAAGAPRGSAATISSAQHAPKDAARLLDRVARADEATYRARQLVVYFGKPQSAAILDVSSSKQGRFVRTESGDDNRRMWAREDVVEEKGTTAVADASTLRMRIQPADVLAKYEISAEPKERTLGVELIPLTLSRRRDGALIERWWVHEKSGVLYRRALYDGAGKIVGMSTVIDMDWGEPGPPEPPSDEEVDAWVRVNRSADAPLRLSNGYRLWQTYELELDGRRTDQWVYTDGLHALSVFRQAGSLHAPATFSPTAVGADRVWTGPGPGTWAWEGGGSSWLVVAEEPGMQAAEIVQPFPRGGPSVWARMGSVWSRLFGSVAGLFD